VSSFLHADIEDGTSHPRQPRTGKENCRITFITSCSCVAALLLLAIHLKVYQVMYHTYVQKHIASHNLKWDSPSPVSSRVHCSLSCIVESPKQSRNRVERVQETLLLPEKGF